MARPRKTVDQIKLMEMAANCCTNEEIAAVLGVSDDTLTRRFADLLRRGRAEARASLRSLQFKAAKEGNPSLLVWLGKQLLGQADKAEVSGAGGGPIQVLTNATLPHE